MNQLTRRVKLLLPKDLFRRSLIIIIAPMILLQAAIAWIFMERHWERVTEQLSETTVQEIALFADLYDENVKPGETAYPETAHDTNTAATIRQINHIAGTFGLSVSINRNGTLPPVSVQPFIPLLHFSLSHALGQIVNRPFWLDTTSHDKHVDIRIILNDGAVMRIQVPRSRVYATNSHIFIVWMVIISSLLILIAVSFLRNQLKPIQRLAHIAEAFGKGQNVEGVKLAGASEIRRATLAFITMKNRIDRYLQQRTNMLAGVSHDLRTPLTRFKLELAMLENKADVTALRHDVEEMEKMLEAYLAFAKNEQQEKTSRLDLAAMLDEITANARRRKHTSISLETDRSMMVSGRRNALMRSLANVVGNACDYADTVAVTAHRTSGRLTITVDDNGPGIPESQRKEVFRPFHRLDQARNQDQPGVGLGLTIARDVVRTHGGDIKLSASPLGGLRVQIILPE